MVWNLFKFLRKKEETEPVKSGTPTKMIEEVKKGKEVKEETIILNTDTERSEMLWGKKVFHIKNQEPRTVSIGDDADVVVCNEILNPREKQAFKLTLLNEGKKSAYCYGCQQVIISGNSNAPKKTLQIKGKNHSYHVVIKEPDQLHRVDIQTKRLVKLEYQSSKPMGANDRLLFLKASFYENVTVLGAKKWDEQTWDTFTDAFRKNSKIFKKTEDKKCTIDLDELLKFYAKSSKEFPNITTDFVQGMRRCIKSAKENGYDLTFVAHQKLSKELQEQLLKPQQEEHKETAAKELQKQLLKAQPREHEETATEKAKRYGELMKKLKGQGYIRKDKGGNYHINPNIPQQERRRIEPDRLAQYMWLMAGGDSDRITWDEAGEGDKFAVSLVAKLEKNAQARNENFYRRFVNKCIAEKTGIQKNEDGSLTLVDPLVFGQAVKEEIGQSRREILAVAVLLFGDTKAVGRKVKNQKGKILTFREMRKLIAPLDQEIDGAKEGEETFSKTDQKETPEVSREGKNKHQRFIEKLKETSYITESKDGQGRKIIKLDPNFRIKKYSDEDIKGLAQELRIYAQRKKSRLVCLMPKEKNSLAKALFQALTPPVRLRPSQNDR